MTAMTAGVRSADEVLAWCRTLIDPALRSAVAGLPHPVQHITGYHFGWWDRRGRPVRAPGGKAVRAALTLLAARAVGGEPAAAVPAAVAVELVHTFSLLHDDVMDGDRTRHHRPAVWRVFGVNSAILTGDALLALAQRVLATSRHQVAAPAIRLLDTAVLRMIEGQCTDLDFERRRDVTVTECLTMITGKTGALFGAACALGAMYGNADRDRTGHLRECGTRLGVAFQIFDDVLGVWGDPAVTGKPVHSDLRSRKKSLPVVAALNSDTPAGRELAALYRRRRPLSEADLVNAALLIDDAGGRAWSRRLADRYRIEAVRRLKSADPEARAGAELIALAHLLTHRDH